MRQYQPHMILFPELHSYYLTKFDKEVAFNQDQVRKMILKMITQRRDEIKKDPSIVN
jgi:hypothetical protein